MYVDVGCTDDVEMVDQVKSDRDREIGRERETENCERTKRAEEGEEVEADADAEEEEEEDEEGGVVVGKSTSKMRNGKRKTLSQIATRENIVLSCRIFSSYR